MQGTKQHGQFATSPPATYYCRRFELADPARYPIGTRVQVTNALPDEIADYVRIDDNGAARWSGVDKGSNGFLDRSKTTMDFDNATRTLTVSPTGSDFVLRSSRRDFRFSSLSLQISDVEGTHFVYLDSDGALAELLAFDERIITEWAFVSEIYWDAGAKVGILVADERHGAQLEGDDHLARHRALGAQLDRSNRSAVFDITGGAGSPNGNGSIDSHAQVSFADGQIYDEDLRLRSVDAPQVLSPIAQLPVYYLDGPNWRMKPADNFPLVQSGALGHDGVTPIYTGASGRCAYNPISGGEGALVEVSNNDYFCVHIAAINGLRNRVASFLGHQIYLTAPAAEAGVPEELKTLYTIGLPTLEWVWLYTIAFQTGAYGNAVAARIVSSTSDLALDWRNVARLP